jgi:hypothetical protein
MPWWCTPSKQVVGACSRSSGGARGELASPQRPLPIGRRPGPVTTNPGAPRRLARRLLMTNWSWSPSSLTISGGPTRGDLIYPRGLLWGYHDADAVASLGLTTHPHWWIVFKIARNYARRSYRVSLFYRARRGHRAKVRSFVSLANATTSTPKPKSFTTPIQHEWRFAASGAGDPAGSDAWCWWSLRPWPAVQLAAPDMISFLTWRRKLQRVGTRWGRREREQN